MSNDFRVFGSASTGDHQNVVGCEQLLGKRFPVGLDAVAVVGDELGEWLVLFIALLAVLAGAGGPAAIAR